uniref:NR LBD domain-containing protein n=1 Tax=Schistocephalus solidus TaxID=70667 RepID=A0A183S8H8_SCHSO
LGTKEQERYTDILLPKNSCDFTFDEIVKQNSETFRENSSLFNIRYQCLKLVKNYTDDFLTLASIVDCEWENFKLQTMTEDQLKCLIFVCALQSPRDAEIRTHLLSRVEPDPDAILRPLLAIFQQTMDTLLTDTEGAASYLDDIIVPGSNSD